MFRRANIFWRNVFFWANRILSPLGTGQGTKTDEFLENIQTAFGPPSFSENIIAIFSERQKKTYIKVQNLQHNFLDEKGPPSLPLELFQKFIRFGTLTRS